MRILFIHNAYLHRGGEDSVVAAEIDLLRKFGHDVVVYERNNIDVEQLGRIQVLRDTIWSQRSYRALTTLVGKFKPDLAHIHNFFPLISPSAHWALSALNIPVVQTLHNFRLLCLQATFLREGAVCEKCVGRFPWRGVVHRCYRDSLAASSAVAATIGVHRVMQTFKNKVTRYIALSEFARTRLIEGGLDAGRIVVKPNFADIPPVPEQPRAAGLFVGRLSEEKGVAVLLEALAPGRFPNVNVIGTGPLEIDVVKHPHVKSMGWQSQANVYRYMRRASYLILPSPCHESFPRTIVEAFACGLPVIASRLGAMAELVDDGRTGLLFQPGSADDLAAKIAWAEQHPDSMRRMGENAREEYEAKFTPEKNYLQLMAIYAGALERRKLPRYDAGTRTAHGSTSTL